MSTQDKPTFEQYADLISKVESEVGMSHAAWDSVPPEEVVHAVLKHAALLRANAGQVPEGWKLIAVNPAFDDLMYWLDRCHDKGHLENCYDLVAPYEAFQYRAAAPSAPTQPEQDGEPLFLLHTGQIDSGGEQDEWETEADSQQRVDEFCRKHPGQTIKLFAAQQLSAERGGDAFELPDDFRVPLDSLDADADYLLGRVIADPRCAADVAATIRSHVDFARVAITDLFKAYKPEWPIDYDALASRPAEQPTDPMKWKLPCDVMIGHVTLLQGSSLRSLVEHAQRLDVDAAKWEASQKAEQPSAPVQGEATWMDDQMIRFASSVLLSGPRSESIEERLQVFRQHEALRGQVTPPTAQQGEPVAALIRSRVLRTEARIAFDGKDHFSDWGEWEPASLSLAKAVTDPQRNTPEVWQARLLVDATPPTAQQAEQPAQGEDAQAKIDNAAVDSFAARMKWKLAKARAKGRSGWQDRAWTPEQISQALRAHVEKGDPTDVANYCMFLAARGEPITPAHHPGAELLALNAQAVESKQVSPGAKGEVQPLEVVNRLGFKLALDEDLRQRADKIASALWGSRVNFDVEQAAATLIWEMRDALVASATAPSSPPVAQDAQQGQGDEWWCDLAQRHASADWNSDEPDGYLNAVKAVVNDALRSLPTSGGEPVGFAAGPLVWNGRQTETVIKITREPQPQYGFVHAVYATPPTTAGEQARQAMSDEQIDAVQRDYIQKGMLGPRHFARAVEAHHGITAAPGAGGEGK